MACCKIVQLNVPIMLRSKMNVVNQGSFQVCCSVKKAAVVDLFIKYSYLYEQF